VIIQVKDVRFALPSQGADTQLIRFTDRLQIKNEMTLEQVIKAPAAARRMFAKTSLMNVSLPNLLERSDPFLRGFPRNDFRSFEADFAIGKGALADCADWANTFAQLAASLVPGDARIGSSGWEEFKLSEHPLTSAYVRHPWSLGPDRPFSLGVTCSYFKVCDSTKCLGADLEFSYQFSGNVITQPDWLTLDQKVRDLLNDVLVDFAKQGGVQ
jgi:hypothetical protein